MSHSNGTDDARRCVRPRLTPAEAGALVELLSQSIRQTMEALNDPRFPLDQRAAVRLALVQVQGAELAVSTALEEPECALPRFAKPEAVELCALLDSVLEEAPAAGIGPERIERIQLARRALAVSLVGL